MKKKALSLALALVMCLGLTVPAFAADKDFKIEYDVLEKYTGNGGTVVIPDGVSMINFDAFRDCTSVTKVIMPDSVRWIYDGAFKGCTNLKEITFSKNIEKISDGVFNDTAWFKNQPEFVVVNGILIGYQGNASEITIPSGVKYINGDVFSRNNKLTSVIIPNGVTGIGGLAFMDCTNLTNISIPASVKDFGVGVFTRTPWEAASFGDFEIINGVLLQYRGSGSNVTVPGTVEKIGYGAFAFCESVTNVTIPEGVTTIQGNVFDECPNLKSVTIPASAVNFEWDIFGLDSNITDVYYGGTQAQWNRLKDNLGLSIKAPDGAAMHYNVSISAPTTPVEPEKPAEVKTANPSSDKLTVNGVEGTPTIYNIDNSNYFKIRDVAALLNGTEKQFSVGYDGERQSVTATTGQSYEKLPTDLAGAPAGAGEAKASGDAIYVNGTKITPEVYNINGNNYFKLRDLGQALDFYIGWTLERGVYIETDKPYAG